MVISMMKDERSGKSLLSWGPRCIAYRKLDKNLEGECYKSTKKYIVTKSLTFDEYKGCFLMLKQYTDNK